MTPADRQQWLYYKELRLQRLREEYAFGCCWIKGFAYCYQGIDLAEKIRKLEAEEYSEITKEPEGKREDCELINRMLKDREGRKCTCNNPDPFDKDVVHRKDGPCYYKPKPDAGEGKTPEKLFGKCQFYDLDEFANKFDLNQKICKVRDTIGANNQEEREFRKALLDFLSHPNFKIFPGEYLTFEEIQARFADLHKRFL